MSGIRFHKAVQLLNYFAIQEGGIINRMKAIKLVWLSDRLHANLYGRTISNDIYYALRNGPVPSTTSDITKCNAEYLEPQELEYATSYLQREGEYNIKSKASVDFDELSETDKNIISLIYKKFGRLSEYQLSTLSHDFPEWKQHSSQLKVYPSSRFQLKPEDLLMPVDDIKGGQENIGKLFNVYNDDNEIYNDLKTSLIRYTYC